jgi:inner membrane protein
MFHSLLFAVIVSYILYLWSSVAGFGFFIGYLSHLFLDVLTKRGVRLFWPFFKFKIGFGIKSGGLVEEVLFVLLLLADIWLGFKIVF